MNLTWYRDLIIMKPLSLGFLEKPKKRFTIHSFKMYEQNIKHSVLIEKSKQNVFSLFNLVSGKISFWEMFLFIHEQWKLLGFPASFRQDLETFSVSCLYFHVSFLSSLFFLVYNPLFFLINRESENHLVKWSQMNTMKDVDAWCQPDWWHNDGSLSCGSTIATQCP